MPNYCNYAMRVKGSAESIDEMEKRLKDYDNRPHFWRVFDADRSDDVSAVPDGDDADMVTEFSGYCAWSVFSCMCEGAGTYATDFADKGVSTSLSKTAKELGIEIEVYSEEPAIGFAEHFRYDANGNALAEDETEYEEVWWDRDEYETFADLDAEYGLTERGVTEEQFGDEDWVGIGGYEWEWAF